MWVLLCVFYIVREPDSWAIWLYAALALAWVVIAVIYVKYSTSSSRGIIILDKDSICMSECAVLVKGNKISAPMSMDIPWINVDYIDNRAIVLKDGTKYSDRNWNFAKRFYQREKTSPFGEEGWAKIRHYLREYKEQKIY